MKKSIIPRGVNRIFTFFLAVVMLIMLIPDQSTSFLSVHAADSAPVTSKKGMQGLNPGKALNADHILMNLDISRYLTTTESSYYKKITVSGKNWYLNTSFLLSDFPAWDLKSLHDKGVQFYVVLLCQKTNVLTYNPSSTSANYYGFNTWTAEGRALLEGVLDAIGAEIGEYVDYWIVGNEINDQHAWYEMNAKNLDEYVLYYEKAMRICNNVMKNYNSNSRVMVSLDHYWNSTDGNRYNSRTLLEKLAKKSKDGGDYNWGVAYHATPDNFESPRFWDDASSGAINSRDAKMVTLNNLNVLTGFMSESNMKYNGSVRDISLTELEFNAYENNKKNEELQAAAVARAYYTVEANPYIKSMMILEYQDSAAHTNQGWYFGFTRSDGSKRPVHDMYKNIDTIDGWEDTDKYRSYFGGGSWTTIVPGFKWEMIKKDPLRIRLSAKSLSVESGGPIWLKAEGRGGSGGYTYIFRVASQGSAWVSDSYTVQEGSSAILNTNVRLIPAENNAIHVYVKDAAGDVVDEVVSVTCQGTVDFKDGIEKIGTQLYYLKDGRVDNTFYGGVQYEGAWYYVSYGSYVVPEGEFPSYYSYLYMPDGRLVYIRNKKLETPSATEITYNGIKYLFNGSIGVPSGNPAGWSDYTSLGKYYFQSNGSPANGFVKLSGNWYYFTPYGLSLTGFVQTGGKTYYLDGKGVMQTGWQQINGLWYLFDESGAMQTGWIKRGSNWYYLYGNGVMAANTWIDGLYYVKSNGVMAQNEWINNKYYVDSSGKVAGAGWQKNSYGWWYKQSDGSYPKNQWMEIGGVWYHFDAQGYMQTGWQQINGVWYYFNTSGKMQTGWQQINSVWYYFNTSGKMQTGWQQINGIWYYFNTSGKMQTGWQQINGYWYYFNTSGKMQTGWQQINGYWYYFNTSGKMQTGWLVYQDRRYYLASGGKMQTGWVKHEDNWYYMDSKGIMLQETWIDDTYYVKADGTMAVDEWIGEDYVDSNGKRVVPEEQE